MKGPVWITGAGKGIGRALALRLARNGAHVIASARTGADLESLRAEAEAQGAAGRVTPLALDVTDADACARAFKDIESAHGALFQIVLSAGVGEPVSTADFDAAKARRITDVNIMGVVHVLAPAVPAFMARGGGRIAVIGSVAGYNGLPGAGVYCASKAALIVLCESLRPELAARGVVLQLVSPGFVATPMTEKNDFPMPFLMTADQAAARIAAGLASDRFEIVFPRRLAWILKALRMLPYGLYFRITGRLTEDGEWKTKPPKG